MKDGGFFGSTRAKSPLNARRTHVYGNFGADCLTHGYREFFYMQVAVGVNQSDLGLLGLS